MLSCMMYMANQEERKKDGVVYTEGVDVITRKRGT